MVIIAPSKIAVSCQKTVYTKLLTPSAPPTTALTNVSTIALRLSPEVPAPQRVWNVSNLCITIFQSCAIVVGFGSDAEDPSPIQEPQPVIDLR